MKFLIISTYFCVDGIIGAVRPTKIAKYLLKKGHEVNVITTTPMDIMRQSSMFADVSKCSDFFVIPHERETGYQRELLLRVMNASTPTRENDKSNKKLMRRLKEFYRKNKILCEINRFHSEIRRIHNELKYANNAIEMIRDLGDQRVDVIFSTVNSIGNHFIARAIKHRYPKQFWVADYRDPVWIPTMSSYLLKQFYKNYDTKTGQSADMVSIVSEGYLKALQYSDNLKQTVIRNGFDRDDYRSNNKHQPDPKYLSFVYTGSLYGDRRSFKSLFEVLSKLNAQIQIDIDKVRIIYAGNNVNGLIQQARLYGLEHIVSIAGMLDRTAVTQLQQNADILLISTWNDAHYQGVVPGKLYEYIGAQRPIICIVSGESCDSEIKQMITEGNLGICYEDGCSQTDYPLLEEYIKKAYAEKMLSGEIQYSPKKEYTKLLEYGVLTDRLIQEIHLRNAETN